MFCCYDINGNAFCCPHENEILKYSQDIWKTTEIDYNLWLDKLYRFIGKTHHRHIHTNLLYALCHLPLFVYLKNELNVAIQTINGIYALDCFDVFNAHSNEKKGYNEDTMLSTYIYKFYNDENGLNRLSQRVWLLYQTCVHMGKVPTTIRYMYEKVIKFRRIPDFFSLIGYQPISSDTHIMVYRLGSMLSNICRPNKSHLIVYTLTRPLIVVSQAEWNLLCHCRNKMGWVRRTKEQMIRVNFGSRSWEAEWHITQVYYNNNKYNEKWEDRIMWMALMFYQMYIGKMSISSMPKDVVISVTKLLV